MEKHLRSTFVTYLSERIPVVASGYSARRLKPAERVQFGVGPFFLAARTKRDVEYFISFIPEEQYLGGFYVECGWKLGPTFPVWRDADANRRIRAGTFAFPREDFAVRLFWLCSTRGSIERGWDLFLPEVWSKQEPFQEYASRAYTARFDTVLENMSSSGVSEEFAKRQTALVGADVIDCLTEFGVPFLETARIRHASGQAI